MPEWIVAAEEAGGRLDKFLAAANRAGSRAKAVDALDRGKVFVNDREVARADAGTRVVAGDVVRLWIDRPGSAKRRGAAAGEGRDLPIVYEDDQIVVLNKPPGLLAVPLPRERRSDARSVLEDLEAYLGRNRRRPFVVHRIDRDTSGLVVFAKTLADQTTLKAQFKRREPERVYLAIVYGYPSPPAGTWRDTLVWDTRALIQKETSPRDPRGKPAECHYRVVELLAGAALIEVSLVSGRRNQIRIQARLRGHTLVGERRYVYGPDELRPIVFARQALHAYRLAFRHPSGGRAMRFEAPLPADFSALLEQLRRRES